MKINTALILCAGFGKRLNPITLETPKPLLKINNYTLLDRCINLIMSLNINKILLNSFHLKEQIKQFIKNSNYDIDIKIIEDGDNILDTGGGILNLIKESNDEDFLVFNPDTLWSNQYINELNAMIKFYNAKKFKNVLLLVNKDLSFDKSLKGDFGIENSIIKKTDKNFIYTGCQILNRSIFEQKNIIKFSINECWEDLIKKKQLYGFESKLKFFHLTSLEVFKKLKDL